MSILNPRETNGYLDFDERLRCCRRVASRHLSRCRASNSDGRFFFERDQERLKFQFRPKDIQGRLLRNLVVELNSPALLKFLEAMTGIKGLIADPYYTGGGLHETKKGGHLGIHADFNIHSRMGLERRLNLLVYLNDDWPEDYGGHLELWDRQMNARHHKVLPVLGRAVVFNTSLDSYHGQPEPVTCPPDRSRRSIATYYYTAHEHGVASLPERTTVFKTRPGSADKADRQIRVDHFLRDWSPPKLYRFARRLNPFR